MHLYVDNKHVGIFAPHIPDPCYFMLTRLIVVQRYCIVLMLLLVVVSFRLAVNVSSLAVCFLF